MADEPGQGQGGYVQPSGYDQGGTGGYPPPSYDQSGVAGHPQGGYNQGGYEDYGAQPTESQGGMSYAKTPLGMLKIGEIACLLIAFASLSTHTNSVGSKREGFDHSGRFDFFYFATVTTWLIVIGLFVVFFMRLQEKFSNINWLLLMMVYSTLMAFLLLVSTSLVLDVAVSLRRREVSLAQGKLQRFCDYYETCGNIEAAGAFGIFATVMFVVDAAFYFYKNRVSQNIPTGAQQM